jgi:hypothetical protein
MSNTTYLNWRDKTGYPSNGIGDLDDLKLVIGVGNAGKWISYIKPGFFYDQGIEQYSYISKGEETFAVASLSGVINASSSFRPSWGPNYVTDDTSKHVYTEHRNSYFPALTATWTQVGSSYVYTTAVPTGVVVIGARDLTNILLACEAVSGHVQSPKSYHFDHNTGMVTAYSLTSPVNVFLDTMNYTPDLKIREVVVDEGDSTVRASYLKARDIKASRGSTVVTCTDVNDGLVTHTLDTSKGDWVCLEYYIDRSYCLIDHSTIHVYNTEASGATLNVHYERSVPEYPSMVMLANPVTGQVLQFNPLFSDAFRVGFLYHSLTGTVAVPTKVELCVDKVSAIGVWKEMVKATVRVWDRDGLPIPQTQIRLGFNLPPGSGSVFVLPTPTTTASGSFITKTDNRGEVHWLMQAPNVGVTGQVLLSALTSNNISATANFLALPASSALNSTKYIQGVANIVQSKLRTSKGYSKFYVGATYADGIPKQSSNGIKIKSKNGSTLQFVDINGNETISTNQATHKINSNVTNPFSLGGVYEELGVVVNKTDDLIALSDSGQSPIITFLEEL